VTRSVNDTECTVVTDVSRLAPIKQQCPEHITFDQIKVVIAILHRRFGMQVDNDSDLLTASAAVNLLTLVKHRKMYLYVWYLCVKLSVSSPLYIHLKSALLN